SNGRRATQHQVGLVVSPTRPGASWSAGGRAMTESAMRAVTNKTNKPLAVPLPRGKILRLGPRKTGQISSDDLDHPPLKKLAEAGEIEIHAEGHTPTQGGGGGAHSESAGAPGHTTTTGGRRSGDR